MDSPNRSQTASLLSLITFNWLNETVSKASRVPHLPLDALPPLADTFETKALVKESFSVCFRHQPSCCHRRFIVNICSTSTHSIWARMSTCSGDFCGCTVGPNNSSSRVNQLKSNLGRQYLTYAALAVVSVCASCVSPPPTQSLICVLIVDCVRCTPSCTTGTPCVSPLLSASEDGTNTSTVPSSLADRRQMYTRGHGLFFCSSDQR